MGATEPFAATEWGNNRIPVKMEIKAKGIFFIRKLLVKSGKKEARLGGG